jgi:tripartite-type tricarboxylate transporter receptor subunit TctC
MKKSVFCLAWAVALLAVPPALSAEYPTRSIRLVVPFAAGGGTDLLARLIAPKLTEVLGQQIVVDNRGGAGSVVGTEIVAKAPPDGYTLGFFDSAFTINPAINPSLPYNTEKDFSILNIVATSPTMLVVRSSLPVKTIEDLVKLAKASPGKLTFGSAGPNSSGHLTGVMFNVAAGVDIRHVPFKGAGAAITDLIGGHIDVTYVVPGSVLSHVKAGLMRPLATSGSKRTPVFPDVPTFESVGLGAVNPGNFRFLVAPAGVPRAIQQRLIDAMEKIAPMPDLAQRMADNGYDPAFIGPPKARETVMASIARWKKTMQEPAMKAK